MDTQPTPSLHTIAVIGLGLMGASLAGALQGFGGAAVNGADTNPATCQKALEKGLVNKSFTSAEAAVQNADMVLFCTYGSQLPAVLQNCAHALKPGVVLADICGVKAPLYRRLMPLVPAGAAYVGLHPMAGREEGGIENASPQLYQNSNMVVCPTQRTTPQAIALAEGAARYIGCRTLHTATPEEHDEAIAYTSDLMHLASAGLCLYPPGGLHPAFTGGAYRDCTRVAASAPSGWAELLTENQASVLQCLDSYMGSLAALRGALQENDTKQLEQLLYTAQQNKKEMPKP